MPINVRNACYTFAFLISFFTHAQNSGQNTLNFAKEHINRNPDTVLFHLSQSIHQGGLLDSQMPEAYRLIGICYHIQSRFDSALLYFEKSLDLATLQSDSDMVAKSRLDIGKTLLAKGRMSAAQEHFTEVLVYFEEHEMHDEIVQTLSYMGFLFQRSNDLRVARKMYDRALQQPSGRKHHLMISLATWHGRMNQPDSALMLYDSLLDLPDIQNDYLIMSRIHLNAAIIYDQIGNHEKVIEYSRKALQYNHQLGNLSSKGVIYQNLTQYHFLRGEYERSRVCLDSGYYCAQKVGSLNVYIKLLGIEVEFEKLDGNYRRAEYLMEKYDYLKDSLHRQRQADLAQELNIKYETATNKQRIAELELERKDAALSLARANNQRNIFLSGFGLLIVIAGFLYFQYSTKKKTSEVLTQKNLQISDALAERETLLKEIHHRVKNNLQVISSLLKLQAGSLEDEAAIDAVKQGQHRVKSMALIHQRLYSADDVRGVDIQDYFDNLCSELFSAFGVDTTNTDYHVATNGLKLDIDTVIPLGLIINELVTNSIKYAFDEKTDGMLRIEVSNEGDKLIASVADNGIGMDEKKLSDSNSFGWKMIRSLSRKLKAEIKVHSDQGTTVNLIMSRFKLVK
ncbi:tetratricopeptide repeat-containing sensor histidine kinase [Marinoscillum furvescens]|uniref:histidine kinase n=1 Tax=Marinoscillum furvescens DSM 4134 TaxID=1122208 RepID=A0A3D9L558_MARFU|nr:histidine kinase dimerization/phosphoacceptor domain -containing protein [Marinoscillum furvescens]REE00386.1 two-component sensor histidine kinase [Marinoscillum furvescens DSM 4134]